MFCFFFLTEVGGWIAGGDECCPSCLSSACNAPNRYIEDTSSPNFVGRFSDDLLHTT